MTLDTRDVQLAIQRAQADRDAADAQLRLVMAGARVEDLRQAQSQIETARAELAAARTELEAAEQDLARFESLLANNSGSRKQRDDAATSAIWRAIAWRRRKAACGQRKRSHARLRAGAAPRKWTPRARAWPWSSRRSPHSKRTPAMFRRVTGRRHRHRETGRGRRR